MPVVDAGGNGGYRAWVPGRVIAWLMRATTNERTGFRASRRSQITVRYRLVVETRAVNSSYLAEWLDAHRFAAFEGTKHRRALGTGSNQQFGQRWCRHNNAALDSVDCCDQVKHPTLHVSEYRTVRCMKLVHSSIEQAHQRRRIETYLHSSFPMRWRRPIGSSIRAQSVPAYNSRISPTNSATGRESSSSNCWILNFSSR